VHDYEEKKRIINLRNLYKEFMPKKNKIDSLFLLNTYEQLKKKTLCVLVHI